MREARKAWGPSQDKVVAMLEALPAEQQPQDISKSTVQRWEKGKKAVDPAYIVFLSRHTGRPLDWFVLGPQGRSPVAEGRASAILEMRAVLQSMWEALPTESDEAVLDDLDRAFRDLRPLPPSHEKNGGEAGSGP